MNWIDAHILIFNALDKYWDDTDGYFEELGDMLSDIKLTCYKGKYYTGDPAILSDWQEAWEKIVGGLDKNATNEQIYEVVKTILDYYSKTVEYDLGDSYNVLKKALGIK